MNSDEKLDKILQKFDDHARETREELATIKRGIYGDKANQVPGLIDTDRDQEKRISALEENHKKQKWMVAGVSFSIPVVVHVIKSKLGL